MANVGSGAAGKVLIGNGDGQGPTYVSIGVNSGLTQNGVVIAENNGAFTATAVGTTGQVLTSNGAGVDPTFQTLNIPSWIVVTAANNPVNLVKSQGYIAKGASVVNFVLPATAAIGDMYFIEGYGNLWTLAQNAGQSVSIGLQATTIGVTGSLAASMVSDAVTMLCVTANTEFKIIAPQGNLIVV